MQQKLLTILFTVLETFYQQKKSPQIIGSVLETIQLLTKVELNVPIYCHNGFSLHQHTISTRDRYLGHYLKHDFKIFNRSVKGINLEKEIVSPAILMLEEIFLQPLTFDFRSNYCGQLQGSDHAAETLQSLLIGLEKTELSYLATVFHQLDSNAKEFLMTLNPKKGTSVIDQKEQMLESLQKQCNFVQEIGTAKLLFFSMGILLAETSLPLEWKSFQENHGALFQREIGWKVEEEYQRKVSMQIMLEKKERDGAAAKTVGQQQMSEVKMAKLAREMLDEQVQNEFKVDKHKKVQRDLQIQQIRQSRIMVKATIKVSMRQIEVIMVKMGFDAINNQVSSISKCLDMASHNLDQGIIDNWNNFAPTLSDYHPNKQRHLDPINRIGEMQVWLTRLKNRGMDIETLTSGPGVVFSYKDLNECLQNFATQIVSYGEKEFKNRTQTLQIMINHLQHLLYIKDTRVEGLKAKLRMMHDNITRIVNSKVYEKGNGLIFELDRALREVKFYKDHVKDFEDEMKEFVKVEFKKQLNDKDLQINLCKKETHDIINKIISDFKEMSTKEEIEKMESIKLAKEAAIGMIPGVLYRKQMQGNSPNVSVKDDGRKAQDNNQFTVSNDQTVFKLLKTQGEVIKLQKLMVKQRTLWILKNQTQRIKFEDELQILKNKLTSNQALWEQMADSDKRTKILQQELIFTQKSLSQCEKIIEKLKEELKLSEQERMRLQQYKQNKAQRLSELEDQVKKIDISDQINITKVIDQIKQKDKELASLKVIEKNFNDQINLVEEVTGKRQLQWQKKLNKEVELKKQAMEKLSKVQEELKALELGNKDISSAENGASWKNKCKELYEICRGLADENTDLLSKIKQLSHHISLNRNDSQFLSQPLKSQGNNLPDSQQKTRNNLKESQLTPFGDSSAFDKSLNPISSNADLSNIFGGTSSQKEIPSSTVYSNSFLKSVKHHQYQSNQEHQSKSNRVNQDTIGIYENQPTNNKQAQQSRSAQKTMIVPAMKQSEQQSTSVGERVETQKDLSKTTDYSDAYSYGGTSTVNDFSLLNNFPLPIRPIMGAPLSIEDRNNQMKTQQNSTSKNFVISRSTSQFDPLQQQKPKFLVQGVSNPYQYQQTNKSSNPHQLRSAERIALGRQVALGGAGYQSSSAISFSKANMSVTPTKGNNQIMGSTIKMMQHNEENAGLLLKGNRLHQD